MIALITAVVQLVFLILNTLLEKDKEEKARKDALLTGWDKVIKSGDASTINAFIDKLRK